MKTIAIPLLLAALFLLSPEAAAEPESGNVTVAVGQVTVTPPDGGAAKALKAGDTVAVGSTVKTGADSRAVIVMTKVSAIRIAADSEVVITEMKESDTEPKVLVDLKSGSLGALLKPGAEGKMDFKVKTPSGVAAARGTFFAVVVEDGKGFAQVKNGKIEIVPEKEGN
ncbi:MAG: FecR domain-containing protein [Verrucomicrobiales bacterium]|nr:FecR domain-containing protein [Verrucomicrobiales bacterium]